MMKRLLSLILVLAMVIGIAVPAFAAEAATTPAPAETESTETPAVEEQPKKAEDNFWLEYLKEKNYVQGYPDGTDGLDKAITRAETATILVRAKDMEAEALASNNVKSKFSDMYIGHWANGYVNIASSAANNFIRGHKDGTFRPAANVTNAEAVTMIVRALGITKAEDDQLALNYPQSYIYKAKEMGLLENVTVTDYAAPATRETVFRLLYNLLMNDKYGNHTIVKGIFLENDRTESLLGDREMMLEIIELEQRANYVKESRDFAEKYSRGTNLKLTLPKDKAIVVDGEKDRRAADVEDLLGRVVYVTLDDRLKDKPEAVVQIKIDNTYDYKFGAASKKAKTFKVDGKEYTVELDEKITAKDERLFRTYLNNKDLTYADFATIKYGVDFARATIKNGKVVFIDAFDFDDVSPVKERRESDDYVLIYSDTKDGAIDRLDPRNCVIGFRMVGDDGLFTRIDPKTVNTDHVIHAYGRQGAIVRLDSLVGGKFKYVRVESGNDYYAVLEGENNEYEIYKEASKRPVYSTGGKAGTDGSIYRTLIAKDAHSVLSPFSGKEVTVLKDIFGRLQLIKSGFEFNDNTALVYDMLTRGDMRFLRRDNNFANLKEDWRTNVLENGWKRNTGLESTIGSKLGALTRSDLVYIVGEQDNIANIVVRIASWNEMSKPYEPYVKNSDGTSSGNWYGFAKVDSKRSDRIVLYPVKEAGEEKEVYKYEREYTGYYKNEVLEEWQKGTGTTDVIEKNNNGDKVVRTHLNNTTTYVVLPRTNVFFVDGADRTDRGGRRYMRSGSINDIRNGKDLAVVVSDYEMTQILNTTLYGRTFDPGAGYGLRARHYYNAFTDKKDIANTVVVVNNDKKSIGNKTATVKLTDRKDYTPNTEVIGKLPDNNGGGEFKALIDADRYDYLLRNHLLRYIVDDVYDIYTHKVNEKIVDMVPVVTNRDTYRVLEGIDETRRHASTYYQRLLLQDFNGDVYEVFLSNDASIFGTIDKDKIVRIDDDARKALTVPYEMIGAYSLRNPKRILRDGQGGTDIVALVVTGESAPTANMPYEETRGRFKILNFGDYRDGFGYGYGFNYGWNGQGNFWDPNYRPEGFVKYLNTNPYFVDVYPLNEKDRDWLAPFKVNVAIGYPGFKEFYRLPLFDTDYIRQGQVLTPEFNARVQYAKSLRFAVLRFPNNYFRGEVLEIIDGYEWYLAHRAIIEKRLDEVTFADKEALVKAINEYNAFKDERKDVLSSYYNNLDAKLKKIDPNAKPDPQPAEKTPEEKAQDYKNAHKTVLKLDTNTVKTTDKELVRVALDAYNALPEAEKALLSVEKALLDSLKNKIEELEQATPGQENKLTLVTFQPTLNGAKAILRGLPVGTTESDLEIVYGGAKLLNDINERYSVNGTELVISFAKIAAGLETVAQDAKYGDISKLDIKIKGVPYTIVK